MSSVSRTDVDIFKRLSNPEVIDVQIDFSKGETKTFSDAMDREEKKSDTGKVARKLEEGSTEDAPMECGHGDKSGDDDRAQAEPSPPSDELTEKQGILIELMMMERRGVKLTREFGMSDSIDDLEFELNKQNQCVSAKNAVDFMKDSLKMGCNLLEAGNSKFGPFLELSGWSSVVCQDMSRYENALEKIYKIYWRKSNMNPVMELGWLLVGSIFAFHFKNKFFGVDATSAPVSTPLVRKQNTTNERKRPTLKSPTTLFGLF